MGGAVALHHEPGVGRGTGEVEALDERLGEGRRRVTLVDTGEAGVGNDLIVHVVGVERAATVIPPSPYDPAGAAMRG